jgi:ketosteroid isomerase-like protein
VLLRTRQTDTVRRAFELYWAGDIDGVVAVYHPDVELRAPGLLDRPPQTFAGIPAVRAFLDEMVATGMNTRALDLELVEVEGRVVAAGLLSTPAGVRMHWTYEFCEDLIRRIRVRVEDGWAAMGGREFALGRVDHVPAGGVVALRLGNGESVSAPIDDELVDRATPQAPVLVYFDREGLAGWYLPEHQRGMVVR